MNTKCDRHTYKLIFSFMKTKIHFTEVLNYRYELMTPLDNKFGNADETGNWSGMVGMLQRKVIITTTLLIRRTCHHNFTFLLSYNYNMQFKCKACANEVAL
jgi:hypothetical protein